MENTDLPIDWNVLQMLDNSCKYLALINTKKETIRSRTTSTSKCLDATRALVPNA
jgi:hypothetical protein